MDKQKRIEELAKDMGIAFQLANTTRFGVIAESLISWHWVKLNKDSVVISKEEFWKLSNKFSKKELDEIVEFHKNKTSKETAEKFLIKVKQLVEKWLSRNDEKVGFIFDFEEFVKEQFGAEVEGNSR